MPLRHLVLLTFALLFGACARSLPKWEPPLKKTQFQTVRTTAYTHTESDHTAFGCKNCCGDFLRYDTVHSAAADWGRWPKGTVFRILSTGEVCHVDDIGWALAGRNTIDLYKPTKAAMRAWGTRTEEIEILQWGDPAESLRILKPRKKFRHVARMIKQLEKQI
jgi:3D (Asp-Asp-Asp) domain-containing protein